MSVILALDVSTSCTGICVYDDAGVFLDPPYERAGHCVVLLDRVEFKGCKSFWDKADKVEQALGSLKHPIDRVVLEEPLLGFRPGMSSAQTISQLLRFNGIVSNLARKAFNAEPEYVSANHARKVAGVKLQRTSIAGMSQKEQVFKHMSENDLKDFPWPKKKDGTTPVDWSRDATDAYVIARAAAIDGPPQIVQPMRRAQKSKRQSGV